MVKSLNDFELSVLERISNEYPFLKSHLPILSVERRDFTGVGLFVNFSYQDSSVGYQKIPSNYIALSSNASLLIEGLKNEVAYEVVVTDGKIDFLEIVSNGEDWDGTIRAFHFE